MARHSIHASRKTETVTLRTVAEDVGLAPCSVSAILNNSPAGRSIPQHTRDRVLRAAHQLNYRPNNSARSLRTKRTYTVALLAPDIGNAPAARIAAGAEEYLRSKGYCLLVGTYDASPDWLQDHFTPLRQRGGGHHHAANEATLAGRFSDRLCPFSAGSQAGTGVADPATAVGKTWTGLRGFCR